MRITEEQIRAAAEATLERWPAASAVLLFGSRARGDHLPTSDWDLAVVTDDPLNRPRDLPLLYLAELHHPEMDVAFISDDDIHRHRNLLGRLGCSLARDARPIAGNWSPPTGLTEPEMDRMMYQEEISTSLLRFAEALRSALHARRSSTEAEGQWTANTFVNKSADAAEHLAKAMLVRNCHEPRSIHNLDHLADDIAAVSPELAEAIRSLNGHTQADHTGHYSNSPPATAESVRRAVRRLKRTGQLLATELPHWRSAILDSLMTDIKSAAVDLRDMKAVPLDATDSASGQAAMALRGGRVDALRGAHALWTAWKEPQPEPAAQPAPAAKDDDPSPSPF